jgi:hypothetical protein
MRLPAGRGGASVEAMCGVSGANDRPRCHPLWAEEADSCTRDGNERDRDRDKDSGPEVAGAV